MKLLLVRDVLDAGFTLGRLFVDGTRIGYVCEGRFWI
jgi:hypothetical protein